MFRFFSDSGLSLASGGVVSVARVLGAFMLALPATVLLAAPISAQSAPALPPQGDCDGAVPVLVASDAPAQSDVYSAVTLSGVLAAAHPDWGSCVVLAGQREAPMPADQAARLLAARPSGYVVGGAGAVPASKAPAGFVRVGGADRWATARLVGTQATRIAQGDTGAIGKVVTAAGGGTAARLETPALPPSGDCRGAVPVLVASDVAAQSDIYSAVTLTGVLDAAYPVAGACVVLAGRRTEPLPETQLARLAVARSAGYVVGGVGAVPVSKVPAGFVRVGGADRWATARLVGAQATRIAAGLSGQASASAVTPSQVAPSFAAQTGLNVAGMGVFDELLPEFMQEHGIPGAAIAVVKDGRLVLAKGYGLADVEVGEAVQPDSLFRIASISKPVTAAAVLELVEDDRLDLDAKAFDILDQFEAPPGTTMDPRILDITVRQLLHHSAGWDRDQSYDPMFISPRIEQELGVPKPVGCPDAIRYMMGRPLDFDPGTRYAYSNFGYCVLGRIIEEVSGDTYESFVAEQVLRPVGITRMRIGGTLAEERADGEVRYHGPHAESSVPSVMPGTAQRVPSAYGGFYLRGLDAHGGWIASPVDLVRFVTALDGSRSVSLLDSASVDAMLARPTAPLWGGSAFHYGMGWLVRPVGDDANWWHNGLLPGVNSLLVRTHDGLAWAAIFNADEQEFFRLESEIDQLMWRAVDAVSAWPGHDLFPYFS